MAGVHVTGRTRPTKVKKQERAGKRKRADVSAEQLEQAVEALDIKGTYKNFADVPLSESTKAGLKAGHFTSLTDIQAKAIPLALKGSDILGAARTGSGKTLAFLIPVLENLYRAQHIGVDAGLGAMIVSPTRELAAQIFEVLLKIGGKGHMFAAGLIIGGKSLQEEQDSLARMNILVCTPGRILQHLSQTAAFDVDNLKMLVLDEADRILDMGFQRDVDAIVEYLPKERQTLLFSATQTKKVSDLARLSLRNPEYVAVHETASVATPKNLQQTYIIARLPQKLDTLWSFIQTEKKSKILVFFSSGKQVRFVYEAFRKMQPGIPLLHLLGRQKQTTRLEITSKFSSAKHSCLFATDIVARGLDFPAVDWVVQVDCPEDADTYIHRVGRTARYERDGKAVLFIDPSEEEGMLKRLEQKKIPIERKNIRQKKQKNIRDELGKLCFQDTQIRYLAQKAFIAYATSIKVQKDKEIFDLNRLELEEYSSSLGLPGAPKIKFQSGEKLKALKNRSRQAELGDSSDSDTAPKVRTKHDRMFERQNQDVLSAHYSKLKHDDSLINDSVANGADSDDDDFLAVKQRIPASSKPTSTLPSNPAPTLTGSATNVIVSLPGAAEPLIIDSKRREKLLTSKKKLLKYQNPGTKLIFADDGTAHPMYELQDEESFKAQGGGVDAQRAAFVEEEAERVRAADVQDKEVAREKRRVKKEKRKAREREEAEADAEVDVDGDGDDGMEQDEDAFANFVSDARDEDDESGSGQEDDKAPTKRPKKWFEDESDDEGGRATKGKKHKRRHVEEPETLEDLEKLASGLLG